MGRSCDRSCKEPIYLCKLTQISHMKQGKCKFFHLLTPKMQAPRITTTMATTLTVISNCKNFRSVSNTLRPHLTVCTMLLKSSLRRTTSEDSLATSVPAAFYNIKKNVYEDTRMKRKVVKNSYQSYQLYIGKD